MKKLKFLLSLTLSIFAILPISAQYRTEKDIKSMISHGIVNTPQVLNDTEHNWNILPLGKEVSLRKGFKGIKLTELEDTLLSIFDDVLINSKLPRCYFIVSDGNIGICKLDGTIVVPPVSGKPRKIYSIGGLRVGDTFPYDDFLDYIHAKLGSKARGIGGCMAAVLNEKTLEPIIPFGKYDLILFTMRRVSAYYYVAKYDGEKYLWGMTNNNGEEIVPCLYRSIALKDGKFQGDDSEDMFVKLNRIKRDIDEYNQKNADPFKAFADFGRFFSAVGSFLIKLDESLIEYGVYDAIQQYQPKDSYVSSPSIGVGGAISSGNYQAQYDQWASRAEKNYNSITNLGYSKTDKNGEKSGSANGSMSSSNYTQMKRALREAQTEMKQIRLKASKKGVTITKSKYEDIQVSY